MPKIKLLSDKVINQIAAGEVVDRPISVIKELVENSLDAGASDIIVKIERGGHNLISVADNGHGIDKSQLEIALERHATSKLDESDINRISFFGFRGEALPSIASVSKLKITSRTKSEDAYEITVNGGEKSAITPAARGFGTTVEVRDIFSYTPARLKFLKSEKSEISAAIDILHKFALANENVSFKLVSNNKVIQDIKVEKDASVELRLVEVLGTDFVKNSVQFAGENEFLKIHGYAGLPTLNASSGLYQYYFINGRSIKDKLLIQAVKIAYQNLIPHGRYPKIVLFLEIDPYRVDVNVHPTKAEVRFRDPNDVKNLIINTIRAAIKSKMYAASSTVSFIMPKPISNDVRQAVQNLYSNPQSQTRAVGNVQSFPPVFSEKIQQTFQKPQENIQPQFFEEPKLGYAKCQIGNTYIISETKEGLIIVDQHAAHERLVLEGMKTQLDRGAVQTQKLLLPQEIILAENLVTKIVEYKDSLESYGFGIEILSDRSFSVTKIPVVFDKVGILDFMTEIAEYLHEHEGVDILTERRDFILGNIACKSSIRAGRKMNVEEMNGLLRDMERTPFSGQCNHGRPTYTKITLADMEKIFERT